MPVTHRTWQEEWRCKTMAKYRDAIKQFQSIYGLINDFIFNFSVMYFKLHLNQIS